MVMPLMTPDIQDKPAETGRSGKWWNATLVSLMVTISVCLLITIVVPDVSWNIFGTEVIFLFVAAPVCIVLATISFVKREKQSVWTSIVALPCLALLALMLVSAIGRLGQQWLSAHDEKASLDQIKADPEIALREHWFTTNNLEKEHAFFDVLANHSGEPEVQFSASQVERIYAEMPPEHRDMLFKQAACTPEFISAHFQEAFDLASKNLPDMLVNILQHPHTPLQLVEQVMFFQKQLPSELPYQAGKILRLHKSDVPADPRGILQPYAREAEGKFFVLTLDGNNFRTLDGGGSRKFSYYSYDVNTYVPGMPIMYLNPYVPGVPQDFDLMQLSPDELAFLPGLYDEDTAEDTQQLHLAEAFALEHNRQVFRQKTGRPSSP